MSKIADIAQPKTRDPVVALVEQFFPLYENSRAAQAALQQACRDYEDAHGIPHPGVLYDYHDALLIEFMRQDDVAAKALGDVEEPMLATVPTSLEGVAALIRYAIVNVYDYDIEDCDQGPEVRALRSALAYFGHEGMAKLAAAIKGHATHNDKMGTS